MKLKVGDKILKNGFSDVAYFIISFSNTEVEISQKKDCIKGYGEYVPLKNIKKIAGVFIVVN